MVCGSRRRPRSTTSHKDVKRRWQVCKQARRGSAARLHVCDLYGPSGYAHYSSGSCCIGLQGLDMLHYRQLVEHS